MPRGGNNNPNGASPRCTAKQVTEALLKRDGNLGAPIFYLKTQARGRGFIERIKQTSANGEPIDSAA